MHYSISDTAEYGDMTRGPRIVTDADEGRDEEDPRRDPVAASSRRSGSPRTRPAGPNFNKLRDAAARAPDREGRRPSCAAMMPWIGPGKAKPRDVSGG